MTLPSVLGRLLIFVCTGIGFVGCFPLTGNNLDEEKNPHFLTGKSRVNSMDYQGAIESFEKALEANPRSASAHFELGLLYEQRRNDYAAAIYHFQKHLQLRPKSNMAELVRQRIGSCKVELAKTVAFSLVNQQVHASLDRLTSENGALRRQVEQLKAQLAQTTASPMNPVPVGSNAQPASSPAAHPERATNPPTRQIAAPATLAPSPATDLPRTHTISQNETLFSIGRRYGVSVGALQSANPGIDARRLRRGQVIKIPAPRN